MITVDALDAIPAVRHAFFTRAGGVSRGAYASLNCGFGSGDDPAAVATNRARAMEMLGQRPEALACGYQVHSARVAAVEEPWPRERAPQVDALVTTRSDVVLGILTADCAPVLFADPGASVVGAAHAGWRGAQSGVLEETIDAMCRLGAERGRIVAAIGPTIGKDSYEVGAEFVERFLGEDPGNERFFGPARRPGHRHFDLPGYAAARLHRAGVAVVVDCEADTCADEGQFFSYRRACVRGERAYGRGLSAIVLTG